MGTTLRAELSKKNPYFIEKHRYYELKHFCLQYNSWKKAYILLNGLSNSYPRLENTRFKHWRGDPTGSAAIRQLYFVSRIDMIEKVAKEVDPELSSYILKGVTEGWSYDILKARLGIPCCKDIYYDLYRKFFWLLDKERK